MDLEKDQISQFYYAIANGIIVVWFGIILRNRFLSSHGMALAGS